MQAIYIQRGEVIDYTPSVNIAAGQVVVQNGLVGIARTPIAANALGSLAVVGLFRVVKANLEINSGAALYWDADGNPYNGTAGTGCATTNASGNTFMGFGTAAAGATDETVNVRLFGVTVSATIHNALSAAIADPGDGEAIPVANSGHCALVTADAETRTLADPSYVGQQLLLCLDTDGGDCAITAASAINQTGNNTITLDDAGDTVLLAAVSVGDAAKWRVVANDGGTLSTV